MQLKARMLSEPGLHFLGLMGLVVVNDEMKIEGLRHHAVNLFEEANELAGAVARHAFANDLAGLSVKSCSTALLQGQSWLGAGSSAWFGEVGIIRQFDLKVRM